MKRAILPFTQCTQQLVNFRTRNLIGSALALNLQDWGLEAQFVFVCDDIDTPIP